MSGIVFDWPARNLTQRIPQPLDQWIRHVVSVAVHSIVTGKWHSIQ
jgi:hypothetical protein